MQLAQLECDKFATEKGYGVALQSAYSKLYAYHLYHPTQVFSYENITFIDPLVNWFFGQVPSLDERLLSIEQLKESAKLKLQNEEQLKIAVQEANEPDHKLS